MQVIAVSLIGIPASGKTTLAQRLIELSRKCSLDVSIVVISFDDYIQIDYSDATQGDYKRMREELLTKIENLIMTLKKTDRWEDVKLLDSTKLKLKPNRPVLVIFDDNMYFRSMRQKVRAICRKTQCDYFQIFVKTTLSEAILRNESRKAQVPEEVIRKMFEKLETPQNSRTIELEAEIEDDLLLLMIKERIGNPENLELPPPPQELQLQSLIHEADIQTRKELTNKIKDLKASGANIAQVCLELNRKRKEFLDDLRAQKLNPPDTDSLRAAFHCYLDE